MNKVEQYGHKAKTVRSACGGSYDRVCTLCGKIVAQLDYDQLRPTKEGLEKCLKLCPFCGSEASVYTKHGLAGIEYQVACKASDANFHGTAGVMDEWCNSELDYWATTEEEAVEFWNRRPIEDAQATEIERLKVENDAHEKGILEKEVVRRQADKIERLKEDLNKWNDPLSYIEADSHNRIVQSLKDEIERLKEVLRRLHTRIDDPAWTIKSHLEAIEKALRETEK